MQTCSHWLQNSCNLALTGGVGRSSVWVGDCMGGAEVEHRLTFPDPTQLTCSGPTLKIYRHWPNRPVDQYAICVEHCIPVRWSFLHNTRLVCRWWQQANCADIVHQSIILSPQEVLWQLHEHDRWKNNFPGTSPLVLLSHFPSSVVTFAFLVF